VTGSHELLPNGTVPEHTDGHEPKHGRQRPRIFRRLRPTRLARVLADHDEAEAILADEQALSVHCLKLWPVDREVSVVVLSDLEVALLVSGRTCRVAPQILADRLLRAETFCDRAVGSIVASALHES
jgi:hypothetical protein